MSALETKAEGNHLIVSRVQALTLSSLPAPWHVCQWSSCRAKGIRCERREHTPLSLKTVEPQTSDKQISFESTFE
jgi:hypothetical protein